MRSSDLVADCDRCAALCCIWMAFDASPAFAFSKPAGVACAHLRVHRCTIHAHKAARGFAGCAAYDCHGAGQRATRLFAAEPLGDREKHAVFAVLRELHELAWMLDGARRFAPIDEAVLARLEALAQGSAAELLAADLAPHRRAVREQLAHVRGSIAP